MVESSFKINLNKRSPKKLKACLFVLVIHDVQLTINSTNDNLKSVLSFSA